MSDKRVTIIAGVSGSGKGHLRTTWPETSKLPLIDLHELREEEPGLAWEEYHAMAHIRLAELLETEDHVVIEGYFLPGSPSLKMLLEFLWKEQAVPNYILLWVPVSVIEQRLAPEDERLEVAKSAWRSLYHGLT